MAACSLAEYEARLQQDSGNVVLLGQLAYDEQDLSALRWLLAPHFHDSTIDGLELLRKRYPLTFALYLVLEATYHYERGDFWSAPRDAVGISANHNADAGRIFRDALRDVGLPTFEQLGGHVHVTPILAHAGIPNYCLNDFFDLLDRATRQEMAVDVPTLLDEWNDRGFPLNIDRPVQRFLLNGGPIAEDFVACCLALSRDDGDNADLDLPRRVLERFDQWRETHDARRPAAHAGRLGRPKLAYDPYGEGVVILLPPVYFAVDRAPRAVTWQIEANDRCRQEATYRRCLTDEVEYRAGAPVNVLTVAPGYTVTVWADEKDLKSWNLVGPHDPPLLAFDSDTGEVLFHRRRDNERDYWISPGQRRLVYPVDWSAAADGARRLVELPNPGGEWARFAFETWLLEPDGCLELTAPNGRRATFRAHLDPLPPRPRLDGTPLLAAGVHGPYDLYGGRPPDLRVPLDPRGHQPHRWKIEVNPIGAADPPERRVFSLESLDNRWIILDDELILPLEAPELLGRSPLGEFQLRLRGPYGRRAEFDIRFAPGLRFVDYPRLDLTGDDHSTTFQIIHAPDLELTAADPRITLGPPQPIQSGGMGRDLSAAAEVSRLPLCLAGEKGRLFFDLPVYRLRFGLVEPENPETFQWQVKPLRLHPEALDAPHTALVRADLPLPPDMGDLAAGWRLVDPDGHTLGETLPSAQRTTRHPQTSLAEWRDTLRAYGRVGTLQLTLQDESGVVRFIDAAHLLPTLELGQTVTHWTTDSAGDHLTVIWEIAAPARRRQLRLWPEDRPWATTPIVLDVPDDAADCAEWALPPGRLSLGAYRAELVIDDPWDSTPPARPGPAANSFLLQPDDPAAALEDARQRACRGELPADEALAWLLYLARTHHAGRTAGLNIAVWRGRSGLSLEQLIWWADAVSALGDESGYKKAREALFASGQFPLAHGLAADRQAAYLAHLPAGLDAAVYRALLPLATGEPRRLCLAELCRAADPTALATVLDEFARGTLPLAAAVALMLPIARQAADYLFDHDTAKAHALLHALVCRSHDERYIMKGSHLETNAGDVKVTGITDLGGNPLPTCRNDGGAYVILGRLWPDESSLRVRIELQQCLIRILEKSAYRCQHRGRPLCDFVFRTKEELKRHNRRVHRMEFSEFVETTNPTVALTQLTIRPPNDSK